MFEYIISVFANGYFSRCGTAAAGDDDLDPGAAPIFPKNFTPACIGNVKGVIAYTNYPRVAVYIDFRNKYNTLQEYEGCAAFFNPLVSGLCIEPISEVEWVL